MNSNPHSVNPVPLASPLSWGVPAIALTGFLMVWLSGINQDAFLWLNGWGHGQFSAIFWANATLLGDGAVALALFSPFVRRHPEIIWSLLIATLFAILWVHGLKPLIGSLRPASVLSPELINIIGIPLYRGSFPSGHTTAAFTLAGVICLARLHPALNITALTLATLAGLSRVMVGAHWPMDVFGGAFGGWIAAILGVWLFRRLARAKNWGEEIPGRGVFNSGLLIIALSLFLHDSGYPDSRLFQDAIAVVCLIILVANFRFLFKARNPAAQ